MKFSEIIDGLDTGLTFTRVSWKGDRFIVKQIPQDIPADVVPRMTSLPKSAKSHINACGGSISYHDQVLLVTKHMSADINDGWCDATYYIPTWDDIFSNDWIETIPSIEKQNDSTDTQKPKIDIITGFAGQGKTRKMIEIVAKIIESTDKRICYFTFADTEKYIRRRLYSSVLRRDDFNINKLTEEEKKKCDECNRHVDLYIIDGSDYDVSSKIMWLLKTLCDKYDVICIDGIEYVYEDFYDNGSIYTTLKELVDKNDIKVIITKQLDRNGNITPDIICQSPYFHIININDNEDDK